MALHDAYARRTPYELAFPDPDAFADLVRRLTEEAEARGVDPGDRAAFTMLGTAGAFVRELQGPDAPSEAIHDYLALVYHAFHFGREGRHVHLVDVHASRHLVDGAIADGHVDPPAVAGYVQLPRHLFWIGGSDPGSAAEAVDGFFWTLGSAGLMHVLLATGMREDRPGLAVVTLPEVPFDEAERWLDAQVRAEGRDFATELPGGELEGLYSFTAAGEVLKLMARLFAYERAVPAAVAEHAPEVPREGAPAPSGLPYRKVGLHG